MRRLRPTGRHVPSHAERVPSPESTDAERPETETSEPRSRRSFVFLGALAAAALAPRPARAQWSGGSRGATGRARFHTVPQRETIPALGSWRDATARLVRRATMGVSIDEIAAARKLGYQGYLNRQLRYTRIRDDVVATNVAARYPLLAQTPEQLAVADQGQVIAQLQQATVYRAAASQRQLYERMVEFWSDHFNIAVTKVGYLKVVDDRDVIRKNALRRFGDLVKASAKSPAMLAYLDQTQSRAGRPNQNYARELMELHTLGVDGGYTQEDVAELSRVLTGWTIRGRGQFYFDPALHDWGQKTVLGVTIPAGNVGMGQDGMKEGERIIDLLLAHPSTARFIAKKMLRWLLTAEPSETQIRTIANVYRSTGGDISAMVRAILNDAWVSAAPVKFKRPFHYVVSATRALNAVVVSADPLHGQISTIGQPLFRWDTPDGYPDLVEYWAGNVVPRWNAAATLANMRNASITVDTAPFMTSSGVDGVIDAINERLFAGEISNALRASLRAYLAAGAYGDTRVRETIGLAIASSEFQWY